MKIGIITYYNVVNYGAVLLAYSMKQTLNNMGHEVVFLQFDRERSNIKRNKTLYQKLRGMSPNARKARRAEEFKVTKFDEFRRDNLSIGDYYNVEQKLDLIIVGSDQIFDCKYEFNDFQFAINAACANVISYAPSFGEFKIDDLPTFDLRDSLKVALLKFKMHSARDKNTELLLEELIGRKPVRVLDPVLLYGFEKEKKKWNNRLIQDSYLIVYAWGGTTNTVEFQESVCDFAKKNGLKTVSIGDRRPWCDIDYSSASPIEFFELYRHCDMVITNMFHGTCFSILNEKPFYSLVMPHNENKLRDLLEFLELETQIVNDITLISNKAIPAIDYIIVNNVIKRHQQESRKYLEQNL